MRPEVVEISKEWREKSHKSDSPMPPMLFVYVEKLAAVLTPKSYDLEDVFAAIALCKHTLSADWMAFTNDCRMQILGIEGKVDAIAIYGTDTSSIVLPYKFRGYQVEWMPPYSETVFLGGRIADAINDGFANPAPSEVLELVAEARKNRDTHRLLIRSALCALSNQFTIQIPHDGPFAWTCR